MNVIRKTKCETCEILDEIKTGKRFWDNVTKALDKNEVDPKEIAARLEGDNYEYYKRLEILPDRKEQDIIAEIFGLEASDLRDEILTYKEMHEELKSLRERNNLSIEELAEKTTISKKFLEDYEFGAKKPSPKHMRKLQDFYKFQFDKLVNKYGWADMLKDEDKPKVTFLRDAGPVPNIRTTVRPDLLTVETMPIIAKNIKAAIKESGLSQSAVSDRTKKKKSGFVSESQLSNVVNAKAVLTVAKLYSISSVLNTTPEMLCAGAENVGKKIKRNPDASEKKEAKNNRGKKSAPKKAKPIVDKTAFKNECVFPNKNSIDNKTNSDSTSGYLFSTQDKTTLSAMMNASDWEEFNTLKEIYALIKDKAYSPSAYEIMKTLVSLHEGFIDRHKEAFVNTALKEIKLG